MKILLCTALLVVLSSRSRDEVTLRFAPEKDTVLVRVFDAEAEYRLTDLTASIDGNTLESPGDLPPYSTSFTEHIAVTDTLGSVGEGRPDEFVRHFDELSQENAQAAGDDETKEELVSVLQGRSVRFAFDEDHESYRVESGDGKELDKEQAADLVADMDLLLVLPDHEVEPGDEWDVDPKLYLAFMWPSGLLDFHVEGQDVADSDREMSRQTLERLEGKGSARLEEVRDDDGVRVAVIHVELDVTTGSQRVEPASEGDEEDSARPEITRDIEIKRTIQGTILWDIEHGHARSAKLECKASRLSSESWSASVEQEEGEAAEVDVERAELLEGTIRYEASIQRQ